MKKIGIIGAGAWGSALAIAVAQARHEVLLRAHESDVVDFINTNHVNPEYLPGVTFPDSVRSTSSLSETVNRDIVLLVTPAQYVREIIMATKSQFGRKTELIICSKGIEQKSGQLLSEIIEDIIPEIPLAILSGPTFAHEVAKGLPAAVTIASKNLNSAKKLVNEFGTPTFRPYASNDIIGAQIGGAVKNVIAIACGIVNGKNFGENARAAIISRGLSEMVRFGIALKADPSTLMGLSGLGDLTLTCTSESSRNYSVGLRLGSGTTVSEILANRKSVAEGIYTAKAICIRGKELGVELPICSGVNEILHNNANIDKTVSQILSRPLRSEI
ncbi:MAG: glycerol-3-phosphate acyltransferase [Alphaproteobacteria bacterium]|jgi:glycerol-3-phosphate dehydrogenase (NAD(P)+)|nr:glycerol-3-phosphate acyltransferase [Alphaproteobacteria bacterium]PPR14009.1 MAG: Glycerol-3-phosphate dehydrogenase [NAD(P)+] [Alphaproteobacteria bacterium MarineAlpha12_Bin1]|tara:strand:- start:14785 stop:15774 length:990 start_codon:yes stop_codon:yes gene_type:complete